LDWCIEQAATRVSYPGGKVTRRKITPLPRGGMNPGLLTLERVPKELIRETVVRVKGTLDFADPYAPEQRVHMPRDGEWPKKPRGGDKPLFKSRRGKEEKPRWRSIKSPRPQRQAALAPPIGSAEQEGRRKTVSRWHRTGRRPDAKGSPLISRCRGAFHKNDRMGERKNDGTVVEKLRERAIPVRKKTGPRTIQGNGTTKHL